MENARQVLTKDQILEHVWDTDGQFVDDNTVPVNISRLKGEVRRFLYPECKGDRLYMDKRKLQRVILCAGILLVTPGTGISPFCAGAWNTSISEDARKLGALSEEYPEEEAALAAVFNGKSSEYRICV